jgi:glycosyltransferase involved in cell wall biosynthesis
LQQLAKSLGIEHAVTFVGWLPHRETLSALQAADVLVFPSLREIGGGVVFEALTVGTIPVVADYGGPGDVVTRDVGYAIPMVSAEQMVSEIDSVLKQLATDSLLVENMRRRAMAYAREVLTYDARARVLTNIAMWAIGRGARPTLLPPGHDRVRQPELGVAPRPSQVAAPRTLRRVATGPCDRD